MVLQPTPHSIHPHAVGEPCNRHCILEREGLVARIAELEAEKADLEYQLANIDFE